MKYQKALGDPATKSGDVEIINDKAIIKLKEPAFGVASGQLAVFYDENRVLGSAFIKSAK